MINWLVIGIGDITRKRVIPAIQAESRSKLCALLTRHPAKAAPYTNAEVFTDLDTALRSMNIDAVYVASPVAVHAEQTVASLQAGKHVLCEKPVAMDYASAKSMADAAHTSNRLLGIAYYRRLFPKIIRAKQLLAQGVIGHLTLAEANCHGWLENSDRPWLQDPALAGGGPLYDIASHRIDCFNFIFGAPVKAIGLRSNVVHKLAVEDSATALIEYENLVRGVVDVRWNSHVPRDQFRVIGTEGELNMDPLSGPRLSYMGKEEMLPAHANVHFPLVENFVSAVLDGTALACPIDEAIWTDWVTGQVISSSETKEAVPLPK